MAYRPERLGPGAIYLRTLDAVFRLHSDLIKVAEVEPQTLWTRRPVPGASPRGSAVELQTLATLPQRTLTHGIGFPLGGMVCDQEFHVEEFRRWTDGLASPWTSEHLSLLDVCGAAGIRSCGFLMPPLQTDAQVKLCVENINRRSAVVGKPLAFETGVNYFRRQTFEMKDGDFFAAIADEADCGILLDLTNLWVNHKNGRENIDDVLARLPLERVWEVHLAGIEFAHGYWLDVHSGDIDDGLADRALDIVGSLSNLGAVILAVAPDRLGRFGTDGFLREMERLCRIWEVPRRTAETRSAPEHNRSLAMTACSPNDWERHLAVRMLADADRPSSPSRSAALVIDERGFALYGELVASFRRGAIADMLYNCTRLLLNAIGEQALRDLLTRYFSTTSPATYPTDEALGFRRFLQAALPAVPGLKDMLAFEASLVEATAESRIVRVTVEKDIDMMLDDIASGRLPGPSSDRPPTLLEIRVGPTPFVRRVEQSNEGGHSSAVL